MGIRGGRDIGRTNMAGRYRCRTSALAGLAALLLTSTGSRGQEAGASEPQVGGGPAKLSRIIVPLQIPIAAIRADAQVRLPKDESGSGNGDTVCKSLLGMKMCVGTKYDYHIVRTGDVTLEPDGAGLRFGVPIRVTGHGGLRGAEAQALHFDAKNFKAAADVDVSVGLRVRPDWCLEAPAEIHYNWTEPPRVEIASGNWINIEGLVRKQIDARLNGVAKKIADSVPCDEIQTALKQAWTIRVVPLKMSGVPDLALVVDPQTIGVSAVSSTQDMVKVVLAADARTSLTTTPPTNLDKGPLPPPSAVSDDSKRASVVLAINAPYALIRNVALEAARRPIPVSAGIVSGEVTITDITIRQDGRKVAMDVAYRLSGLGGVATEGTARLEGVPTVSPDGRSITLADATIAPGHEGAFSPAVAAALNETLRLALSRRPLVDLGPRLDDFANALENLKTDPEKTRGIRVSVSQVQIRVGEIVANPDGLAATATAEADVEADLAAFKLP